MKNQNQNVRNQISAQLFAKVPELSIIQQPFQLQQISKQISIRDFQNQFQLLRAITETKKHKISLRSNSVLQNKKNRYPEQSIYEHSRVIINNHFGSQQKAQNLIKNSKNDYINANYVFQRDVASHSNQPHQMIISQAPLPQTIKDFFQIITENNIECVVMLCMVNQNGKNKCYDYINDASLYKSIELIHQTNEMQIRKMVTLNDHQAQHVIFTAWPDRSVPQNIWSIEPVVKQLISHKNVLIHCSAGLGRSGVVAAIVKIIQGLQKKEEDKVSVFKIARLIRQDRFGAIQNTQQYKCIYQFMEKYARNISNTSI